MIWTNPSAEKLAQKQAQWSSFAT